MKRRRRIHSASFKAEVAIAALRGREAVGEIARRFDVHPNLVTQWRRVVTSRAALLFAREHGSDAADAVRELSDEIAFLARALGRDRGPSEGR